MSLALRLPKPRGLFSFLPTSVYVRDRVMGALLVDCFLLGAELSCCTTKLLVCLDPAIAGELGEPGEFGEVKNWSIDSLFSVLRSILLK